MRTHSRVRTRSGPAVLIFIGAVFLLINLGVLPIAELKAILAKWWPLILVAVGVWQLIQRGHEEEPKS